MQPPSPAQGLRRKAAIGAVENDGGNNARTDTHRTDAPDADRTLRSFTQITRELPTFPEGSPERDNALTNLRNIR
jgi:hypothetical protein